MLSLVGVGEELGAVVVASLVSLVLVSKLPLVPAVSVSPVDLSSSFSSFFSQIISVVLPPVRLSPSGSCIGTCTVDGGWTGGEHVL